MKERLKKPLFFPEQENLRISQSLKERIRSIRALRLDFNALHRAYLEKAVSHCEQECQDELLFDLKNPVKAE